MSLFIVPLVPASAQAPATCSSHGPSGSSEESRPAHTSQAWSLAPHYLPQPQFPQFGDCLRCLRARVASHSSGWAPDPPPPALRTE